MTFFFLSPAEFRAVILLSPKVLWMAAGSSPRQVFQPWALESSGSLRWEKIYTQYPRLCKPAGAIILEAAQNKDHNQ